MGTSIILNTPEDIEAWIAERKRHWPSAARVAEKKRKLDEAIASGGLLPDHLMKRPRLPFNADATRAGRGRGRGGGRGGRGRGRGSGGARTIPPARAQPPPPPTTTTVKTETRQCVPTTKADSVSGSDSDAPEVLSAKRPPGIKAYESSSSDVEPEQPQIADDDDDPPRTHLPSKTDPCPGGGGVTATAASPAHPPTVPSARPADVSRRAPPPQPKKPPRNPFAAQTSLLRSVSERICCRLLCLR